MTFDAIGIAGSALTVHRKWLDAAADNMANINTAKPTDGNSGVYVAGAVYGDAEGRLVHDPANPLADAEGYVRMPDIDMGAQMGSLIMAQRGYQANAGVVDRAKATYEAALQIGKS
jgi:flagellar basal-body rod protein FlgC